MWSELVQRHAGRHREDLAEPLGGRFVGLAHHRAGGRHAGSHQRGPCRPGQGADCEFGILGPAAGDLIALHRGCHIREKRTKSAPSEAMPQWKHAAWGSARVGDIGVKRVFGPVAERCRARTSASCDGNLTTNVAGNPSPPDRYVTATRYVAPVCPVPTGVTSAVATSTLVPAVLRTFDNQSAVTSSGLPGIVCSAMPKECTA